MTPEERADEIERLLLQFCSNPAQIAKALEAICEAIKNAWQDGYTAGMISEREACTRGQA